MGCGGRTSASHPSSVCTVVKPQLTSLLAKPKTTPEPLTLRDSETKRSALGPALLRVIEVKAINHTVFPSVHWGRVGEKEKKVQRRY